MVDEKYVNIGELDDKVIEECSEVIKSLIKIKRFGLHSSHPDRPESNNKFEVLGEISDLRRVLDNYEKSLHLSDKKAVVISGFPGIGKSYTAMNEDSFKILDSDSSNFSWIKIGVRNPDFPNNYIEHIKLNMYKADIIFVSSHEEVRNALIKNGIDFTLVYPHKSLKNIYLARYEQRGSSKEFIEFISNNWDKFLDEIEQLWRMFNRGIEIDFVELRGNNNVLDIYRDINKFKREK